MQLNDSHTPLVVLYYNKVVLTKNCLNSILKSKYDPKLIFCFNNGSEEKYTQEIQTLFPQINHLGINKNVGFAGGFNHSLRGVFSQGYQRAFFLTNDTTINTTTVKEAIKKAQQTKSDIIAPCILYQFKPESIHSIGAYFNFEKFNLGHYQQRGLKDILVRDQDYIPGTALLITKEAFEELDGTDEDYFMYWEDVDLCFRAHQAGIQMARAYDSIVYHSIGGTCHKKSIYTSYYFNRNRILFCQKFLTKKQLNLALPKIKEEINTAISLYKKNTNKSDQTKLFHLNQILTEFL